MFAFLQDQIQVSLREGRYLHIVLILAALLTFAFLKIFLSAVLVTYIWNTTFISLFPAVKHVSVLDIIVLRIGYFAFLFMS